MYCPRWQLWRTQTCPAIRCHHSLPFVWSHYDNWKLERTQKLLPFCGFEMDKDGQRLWHSVLVSSKLSRLGMAMEHTCTATCTIISTSNFKTLLGDRVQMSVVTAKCSVLLTSSKILLSIATPRSPAVLGSRLICRKFIESWSHHGVMEWPSGPEPIDTTTASGSNCKPLAQLPNPKSW
jgi:hypothetical protein